MNVGDNVKSYVKKQFIRFRVFLIFDAYKRSKYIVKKNIFYSVGDNFFFQPRKLPSDAKMISFGNNVTVASDVTFINHDIIHNVLNNMGYNKYYPYYLRPIKVGDNVFMGSNSVILPNIKIGNNVIIGSGSVVTKDIPDNTVVGGNPAKKICTFDEYVSKREKTYTNDIIEVDNLWRTFNDEKDNK